ncbi:YfjI family protein [Rhodanobacter sp. BL-MT-08]
MSAPLGKILTEPSDAGRSPKALPSPLPEVPAFDAELLPESVRDWCVDAAEGLSVPLDFTAVPAMVALSGTIGRCIGIAMKRHESWHELPILWGCVVGRPSSGKSPALAPSRRMLDRLARVEREAHEVAMREHEKKLLIADALRANAKKAIQRALAKGDLDTATAAAGNALPDGGPPIEPRLVVNDVTIEKLGELLNANPRGLVQCRDELAGWLATLDREGRGGDREFWLECWNGTGAYTVDRIGRGTVRVEACAVSILGGMQPGKLSEYVRGAIRGGFSDDGLMQRFQLAVYPDLPPSWTYSDRPTDQASEARAWATFQRLRGLDPGAVGAQSLDGIDVPILRFDDEAQELLVSWMSSLMHRLRIGDEPAWLESHLSKFRALAGRLALVLHLADDRRGPVSAATLATALRWCEYLEGHARRIYSPASDNSVTIAHAILKKRQKLPEGFTARDIQRHAWSGLEERDAIVLGLERLVEHGYLVESVAQTGGRPSVVYSWCASL